MGSVLLVKPGLVKGAAIDAAGTQYIGTSGGDFYIKLMRARHIFYDPTEEVTGDGDPHPCFENTNMLYGRILLSGAMVASQAIGIHKLSTTTDNPVGTGPGGAVLHYFMLGGEGTTVVTTNEKLVFKMILERIEVNWNRVGRYVGVSMLGKMTDMTAADVTAIETGV